jgi:hypothetical protein
LNQSSKIKPPVVVRPLVVVQQQAVDQDQVDSTMEVEDDDEMEVATPVLVRTHVVNTEPIEIVEKVADSDKNIADPRTPTSRRQDWRLVDTENCQHIRDVDTTLKYRRSDRRSTLRYVDKRVTVVRQKLWL